MNSSMRLKSIKGLLLSLIVGILAFILISMTASAKLNYQDQSNKQSEKKKEEEKDKKKEKSKSDDDDDDDDDDGDDDGDDDDDSDDDGDDDDDDDDDDKDKKKEKSKSDDDDDDDDDDKDKKEEKPDKAAKKSEPKSSSSSKQDSRGIDVRKSVNESAAAPAGAMETVTATVETDPVQSGGDAADDPAIWVHPTNPAKSTIIGTNKQGGIIVYDLAGKQLQYLPDGQMDNVDLRDGFKLGGQTVSIVAASNRKDNTIAIYKVNPQTRMLENVAARSIKHGLTVYGMCLYRSSKTGKTYYFGTSKSGDVEQWEFFDQGGKVDARKVRSLKLGSTVEGCVADDGLGHLYLAEEAVGIWKFGAEPDAGDKGAPVDKVGNGHLFADVEGLAIAYGKNGDGYLIASSQGNNSYVVYRREGANEFVKKFRIGDGGGIDGAEETDGIDVTTANLGPAFPHGVFVVQDGLNDKGNQNFKLVPLETIVKP